MSVGTSLTVRSTPIFLRLWLSWSAAFPSVCSESGYGSVALKPSGNFDFWSSALAFARLYVYFGSVL